MKQILLDAQFIVAKIETCRGAVFPLFILAVFCLLPDRTRNFVAGLPRLNINAAFVALFGLVLITALLYLAYPQYLDHFEPTIAALGQALSRGDNLYPFPEFYPYHGVLYGPGLAISQWIMGGLGLPVMIASKVPGLLALACAILIMWKLSGHALARGYFLLLIPFGLIIFWNRAEPFLLLLVCLTLLFASKRTARWQLAIFVGLLAGAASALKIHGAVYVLVAYLAASMGASITLLELVLIAGAAVPAFLCFFAGREASLEGFVTYLQLAKGHGLSLRFWLANIFFLAFMWTPVLLLMRRSSFDSVWKLMAVFAGEFLITVVAAKPGAGSHHLLPFIPVHAYLIHQMCTAEPKRDDFRVKLLYACVAVTSFLSVLTVLISMSLDWTHQSAVRKELSRFDESHGPLTMGLSDEVEYPLTYLRVTLRGQQIDYGGYTDLAFSGIKTEELEARMRSCSIGAMVLPRNGEPFSKKSFYEDTTLFPATIRQQFTVSYEKIQEGQFFSVYSCKPTGPPASIEPPQK